MNLVCWRQQNWAGLFTAYPRSSFLRLSLSLWKLLWSFLFMSDLSNLVWRLFFERITGKQKRIKPVKFFEAGCCSLFHFHFIRFHSHITQHHSKLESEKERKKKEKKRHKSKNKSYTSFAWPIVSAFNNAQCYSKSKILCMPWLEIFRSVWYLWPFTTRQQKSLNK